MDGARAAHRLGRCGKLDHQRVVERGPVGVPGLDHVDLDVVAAPARGSSPRIAFALMPGGSRMSICARAPTSPPGCARCRRQSVPALSDSRRPEIAVAAADSRKLARQGRVRVVHRVEPRQERGELHDRRFAAQRPRRVTALGARLDVEPEQALLGDGKDA